MSSPPKKLLSTSSPEGIQVASQITPTRLANLLIRKGPLPIRHITAQLAVEVPSFDSLSLSKQRRLIMAAMDQTDPENNVVFEKIGWGQWAVRKVDSDYIVTEGTDDPSKELPQQVNVAEFRNQKLGWSKKKVSNKKEGKLPRRTSITTQSRNLHNTAVPGEPAEHPMVTRSRGQTRETAITSDSESSEEEEDDDDRDEIFAYDNEPIKFANRVPIKVSPPPADAAAARRWSHSAANSRVPVQLRQHLYNRSRLNSMDTLDNYLTSSAQNSTSSVASSGLASPPPAYYSVSPPGGMWPQQAPVSAHYGGNYTAGTGPAADGARRRKSSFNESHVRSTLPSSVPKSQPVTLPPIGVPQNQPLPHLSAAMTAGDDTDEEDWATIGAETLRTATHGRVHKKKRASVSGSRRPSFRHFSVPQSPEDLNDDEKSAALALVELMH
ncbi:hypothetical protein DICA0_D11496 [Diutina catenulata]